MKKRLALSIAALLLLCSCGGKSDYGLRYESPYLPIDHIPEGEAWFYEHGAPFAEEGLPLVLIGSRADYDAFCENLEKTFSKAAADTFREHFEKTEQDLYTQDLFGDWSVAVIYCREPGNVRHIMETLEPQDGIYRIRLSRVETETGESRERGWLIPVWLTKYALQDVSALDAQRTNTYTHRYPLTVTLGEGGEQSCLLEEEDPRACEVHTYGLAYVEIDIAGEKQALETALREGTITPQQLITRARIDAAAGLCQQDAYNDGGTVVYIYENYRLYKLKLLTASGSAAEGDIWITAPDVELNKIK